MIHTKYVFMLGEEFLAKKTPRMAGLDETLKATQKLKPATPLGC